ncbi:MAG: SpoIIE family protein phosphatase [Terracidiphilus sp.]
MPLLLLFLCTGGLLHAHEFDLSNAYIPVLSLDGYWRFHTGDNPAWAQQGFDDTHWPLLMTDENWAQQGYDGYSGFAWYRFHVTLPAGLSHVSLYLPYILTSYQVYANGRQIGAYGKMPPHGVPYWGGGWFRTYAIPDSISATRSVEIAIRVWHWPGWAANFGGGPSFGGALMGDADQIAARDALSRGAHHWDLASTMILALLETLAGVGAFALFLLRRSEREYLWFGVMMLVSAASGWLALSFVFDVWNQLLTGPLTDALPLVGVSLAEAAFYRHLLKGRRTPLFKAAVGCILLTLLFLLVESWAIFDPSFQTGLSSTTVNLLETLLQFPLDIWILLLLFSRARQNWLDARLLLAPVLLQELAELFQRGAIMTFNLGWQQRFGYDIAIVDEPFQIELLQAADALFLLAILAILILRFTRTRGQEEKYAIEFDAARNVQQLLIPVERPLTPGFLIESEYRPAREVGGDFFQVIPNPSDGSVLIVVGDVAGKGLQAGMLVAHIVGTVRNESSHSTDPVRILAALNAQLTAQHHALATCLALRIQADGAATLANAGHLPPYLNGRELPIEGALPLGVIADAEFPVSHLQLAEGDTLMLMTDGIAEAQDAHGELFGFDRICEMLSQRASTTTLAAAAQDFGQQDDITVLTVARVAVAVGD